MMGGGPVVSTNLANTSSQMPFWSAEALIAPTSPEPRPMDSGQTGVGRRRLSESGPAESHLLLYNAAISGAKTAT